VVSALVIFSLCSGKMNILALPFFDDFDLLDEVDGRGWPKVGDDEEETATLESLGSFRDTKLEAEFPLSVSCVQNKS
jgi:hypothetical protein